MIIHLAWKQPERWRKTSIKSTLMPDYRRGALTVFIVFMEDFRGQSIMQKSILSYEWIVYAYNILIHLIRFKFESHLFCSAPLHPSRPLLLWLLPENYLMFWFNFQAWLLFKVMQWFDRKKYNSSWLLAKADQLEYGQRKKLRWLMPICWACWMEWSQKKMARIIHNTNVTNPFDVWIEFHN